MTKWYLYIAYVVAGLIINTNCLAASETEAPMDADKAMTLLKEGNDRYVDGKAQHLRNDQDRRSITVAHGQHPFVSILSCSDSRVPLETIFDAGIGDLFVVRVAGNVADGDEIGSLEYGVGHLESPLLLVLGHTKCGAVTAAVKNSPVKGNIPFLINKIKPAVARTIKNNPLLTGDPLISEVINTNVWQTIEEILKRSEEIREKVNKGEIKVIGGIYDIETGKIAIMGQHPQEKNLVDIPEQKPVAIHETRPVMKPELKTEPRFVNRTVKTEYKYHH